MTRVVLALALCVLPGLAGGCAKQQDEAPASQPAPSVPEPELARGRDACKAYVEKVCECAKTVAAVAEQCKLAKALPDAIEVAVGLTMAADTKRIDVLQGADTIRKTVAECIEQTAKLPSLGCP